MSTIPLHVVELYDDWRRRQAEADRTEQEFEAALCAAYNIKVGDLVVDTRKGRLMRVAEVHVAGLARPLVSRATIVKGDKDRNKDDARREFWLGDDWAHHTGGWTTHADGSTDNFSLRA